MMMPSLLIWLASVFRCVTLFICMCDVTHLYVWRDSFTCVTGLIYMCDMTHLLVWHDSFTCTTGLIYLCDILVWHDSFTRVTWLIYMYIHMYIYTRTYIRENYFFWQGTHLTGSNGAHHHQDHERALRGGAWCHCAGRWSGGMCCNMMPHTATHCHELQHTATYVQPSHMVLIRRYDVALYVCVCVCLCVCVCMCVY